MLFWIMSLEVLENSYLDFFIIKYSLSNSFSTFLGIPSKYKEVRASGQRHLTERLGSRVNLQRKTFQPEIEKHPGTPSQGSVFKLISLQTNSI